MKYYSLQEIVQITGTQKSTILFYMEQSWIDPVAGRAGQWEQAEFDEEDLARVHLICDLQSSMGVNDEAVPIILHLIDQLHYLQNKMI